MEDEQRVERQLWIDLVMVLDFVKYTVILFHLFILYYGLVAEVNLRHEKSFL